MPAGAASSNPPIAEPTAAKMLPDESNTTGVFQMVGTTVGGLYFTNGSSDFFNGSFDVAVVPQPSTLVLAAAAGIGFAAASRRRRIAR